MLYLILLKLNQLLPIEHKKITRNIPEQNAGAASILSQYIVLFNIGGIWNIITGWIENDMQDGTADIKKTIIYYLQNIGTLDLRNV